MSDLVAVAYPDGPEREAELQEALAGQAATV